MWRSNKSCLPVTLCVETSSEGLRLVSEIRAVGKSENSEANTNLLSIPFRLKGLSHIV